MNTTAHQLEHHIETLASLGSVQISQQAQHPEQIQSILDSLVASQDLVGARVTGIGPSDIVAGQVTHLEVPLAVTTPLVRDQGGVKTPIGALTVYATLSSSHNRSIVRAILILCVAGMCIAVITLALYSMLNRSILTPLDEIDQGLKRSDPAQPDFAVSFNEISQQHMIDPLRSIVDSIENMRARIIRSDRVSVQQQLRLARAIEIAGVGYASIDMDKWCFCDCDHTFAAMLDRTTAQIFKPDAIESIQRQMMLDFDREENNARRAAVLNGETIDETFRLIWRSGEIRYIRAILEPQPATAGTPRMLELVAQDVTDMRLTEQRANQAERMSTIGNLTGGVAHDFNNLLAIISGNIELTEVAESDAERSAYLDNALTAVARGAALTQQLLAFARNQPLSPSIIAPYKLLTEMLPMIHMSLGPKVALRLPSHPGNWLIRADPTQLEACLLNIVINAGDAMPNGGTLTLTISDRKIDPHQARQIAGAEPGEYVCIELADSGHGMNRAVAAKAFEPFFTTKNVGKGTGMGLSMVLGFAQQSGGFASLHTIQGRGTAVRVFLPRAISGPQVQQDANALPEEQNGKEFLKDSHVLLIEDEAQLRKLYATYLESMGCKVTEATSGEHAVELAPTLDPPTFILSDVVLPGGLNGVDTADALAPYFPQAAVVFISGFSENAALHNEMLAAGRILLSKPFSRARLEAALIKAIL